MSDRMIQCPHCGQDFKIDESDYALILNRVRTAEFEASIEKRVHDELEIRNQKYETDLHIQKMTQESYDALAVKDPNTLYIII